MYTLSPLPYAASALEPVISARIMELHHGKHHQTYVDKLNAAVGQAGDVLEGKSVEELLKELGSVPEQVRGAVRNHGGGHYNHTLFWECMTPGGAKAPVGELARHMEETFGSFEAFKQQFEAAGAALFGSGWVWLVQEGGMLKIVPLSNQDSPVSTGGRVLLGNDVWEHAYYLDYENRRAEYLTKWWEVVNWEVVGGRYVR